MQPRAASEQLLRVGPATAAGLLLQRTAALTGLALAAAVLLGYLRTLGWSLWLDEAVSAWAVHAPISTYLSSFRSGHSVGLYNMVLYYVLLKPWAALVGQSELALRGFSVICFLAAAGLLYRLAGRWGRPVAVATLIAFLGNPFLADRASEARGYALALLLTVASSELLLCLLDQPRLGLWLAYGLLVAALVAADVFGYLLLLAHALAYLRLRRDRTARTQMLACFAGVSLVVSPLLYLIVRANHAGTNSFGGLTWIEPVTPHSLFATLAELAGNSIPALALAFAAAFFVALRGELPRTLRVWTLYSLALPVVLLAVASIERPLFVSRYLAVASPALALATGVLLAHAVRRASIASLATLTLAGLTLLVSVGAPPVLRVRQNWREAAVSLRAERPEAPIVVASDYTWVAYARYDNWVPPQPLAAAVASGASRVWVLARTYSVDTPAALADARRSLRGYVEARTRRFDGLEAQEWKRR